MMNYEHLEMIVAKEVDWKKTIEKMENKDLGKLYCPDLKCKEDSVGYKVPGIIEEAHIIYKD
jgi:hypothetical protein